MRRLAYLTVVVVIAVFAIGIGLRHHQFSKISPGFDDLSIELFSKESASHYRYTKMIAEGEDIPEVDYQAQHPEGHKVTDDSILEEYVAGYLYRILPLGSMPVGLFVSWFVIIFSSLSIFAVYFLSSTYTGNRVASLLSTLVYTISLPALLRNIGTEFAREHVALPFIFFHAFFFARAVDVGKDLKARIVSALLSGMCLFVALSSWKLCRFYLLIFAVYIFLNFILRKDLRLFKIPVISIVSFAALAGLLVPHMRSDLFLLSLPMLLFYSMILLTIFERYVKQIHFPLLRVPLVAAVFAVLYALFPQSERFGHVYYTTLYQLRFLFQHPEDPSLLPFDARLYWVPGYTHPSLYNFLAYFTIPILAASAGLFRSVVNLIRKRDFIVEQFLVYCFFATLASYLFFERLHVFFIFFVAVFIARSIDFVWSRLKWRPVVFVVLALICFHQVGQALGNWDPVRLMRLLKIRPQQDEMFLETIVNLSDLVKWTEENTPPQSVMLSYWHISVFLLTYADRSTVIHTFFEDAEMRRKIDDFSAALYGSEDEFYDYCRKYEVDYFVYSARFFLDFSILGTRFLADRLDIDENSFAFHAHFFPDRLDRFSLQYQNNCFRVYQVLDEGQEKTDRSVDYQPVFDPRFALTDREMITKFGNEIGMAYFFYYSGLENKKRNANQAALQLFRNSITVGPSFSDAWKEMGDVFKSEGLASQALSAYRQTMSFNPSGPSADGVRSSIDELLSSPVGAYSFVGSNDTGLDTIYTRAILQLGSDSTFAFSNPGFEDLNGQTFAIIERGTYSIADTLITFHVMKQEPGENEYYYLFGLGENILIFDLEKDHLALKGGSNAGEMVMLEFRR